MPTFRQPRSAAFFVDFDAQPRQKLTRPRYRALAAPRLARPFRREQAMPSVRRNSVTIALYMTAIAILVALLGWVWTLPAIEHVSPPEPRPATASSASSSRCDMLIGPAREFCASTVPESAAAAHAARVRHDAQARMHVLIPAALAVGAAVGLVMVAGRRER